MASETKCAKCGKWFVPIQERQNASCCVIHGPNDCCHFSEREVDAPRPAADVGEAVAWAVVGRDAGLMHTTDDYAAARAYLIQLSPSWADGDSWRVVPIVYPATPTASAPQVTGAARALVDKLREVHEHPKYAAVWHIAHAHFGAYDGPKYEQELAALTAALSATPETGR